MSKSSKKIVSKSPDRHTYQKTGYIARQKEKDEPINQEYLNMFDNILNEYKHRFDDPNNCKNNMEYDLLTTDWILEKVRNSDSYAQNLYAAICNNEFQKLDVVPILKNQTWSASWRSAGGIVADMQQKGDYMDWYCSGLHGSADYQDERTKGYVAESQVTEEIKDDLKKLGWRVIEEN